MEAYGVAPGRLQPELTEGVQIAVDDFGTGYSSLSYLNQFPIDVLRIDQSFVKTIDATMETNGVIVSAVIDMGKNLNQRVIAEGAAQEGQLAFLKAHGCASWPDYRASMVRNSHARWHATGGSDETD
jgi:sensor c-di-GMP phosphodiesterase-like protein